MKIRDAYFMLKQEMEKHGLMYLGWEAHLFNHDWESIDFSGTPCRLSFFAKVKGTAAITDHGQKRSICLNVRHILYNNESIVRNTILHEIAHALVGLRDNHSQEWKNTCIEIGALPYPTFQQENYKVVAFTEILANGEVIEFPVEQP